MKHGFTVAAVTAAALATSASAAAELQSGRRDLLGARNQPAPTSAPTGQITAGSAFNPHISLILDGAYHWDNRRGEIAEPAGFAGDHHHGHGHDHHHMLDQGFNLRETEMVFTAAIDNYLDAMVTLALHGDHGIEVEEAFATTRALPAGLQVKFGKFLSDIGYINQQHPHDWDFADRPLMNELLFGDHGLQEAGVQLSWVPATPFYTRFGVEALQGDNYSLVGESDARGPRLFTGFAKAAPNLGYNHALQIGLFGGYTDSWQVEDDHGNHAHEYSGDTWFAGTDWVYRYDAGRCYGAGDVRLQAEYALRVREYQEAGVPGDLSDRQDGLYAQAVYGLAPRWTAGLRYDVVGATNRARNESFGASHRYAANVTFNATEFSRFRLQVNHGRYAEDSGHGHHNDFTQVFLQYVLSMGTHGAHAF